MNQHILPLNNIAIRKKVEVVSDNLLKWFEIGHFTFASFLTLKDLGPEPLLKRTFIRGFKFETLLIVFNFSVQWLNSCKRCIRLCPHFERYSGLKDFVAEQTKLQLSTAISYLHRNIKLSMLGSNLIIVH